VDTESGFMQATIPAGRHTLDARLTDTPIRRWSNIVSAGSLSVFAILLMLSVRRPATVASSATANVAAGAHRLPE
jgi:hypothetical protein